MEWEHKEEWRKFGTDFMVMISRHKRGEEFCWCVYAYLYPKHPKFGTFSVTTTNASSAGVYSVNITAAASSGVSSSYTITITIVDPCAATTFNATSIPNITAVVLVQKTTTITAFTTATSCGSISYELQLPTANTSIATIGTADPSITVNATAAGTIFGNISATLANYPSVTTTVPITIVITSCLITNLTVATPIS